MGEARRRLLSDAASVRWTEAEVVEFRHHLALLAEHEGQEQVSLSSSQLALFWAFPSRLRDAPGSLGGARSGIYLPRPLARFFGWWRSMESWRPAETREVDWREATRLFVTDTTFRRACFAATDLAGSMEPLFALVPRFPRAPGDAVAR